MEYTIIDNKIVFVNVLQDEFQGNPLESWNGNGHIHSFNRRHNNYPSDFDFPDSRIECEKLLQAKFGEDIVILGYFEHGQCDWHISGHMPSGTEGDYRWDGVSFAGVWVPDAECRLHINNMVAKLKRVSKSKQKAARRKIVEECATQACKLYTQYCNGEVYCYSVEVYTLRKEGQENYTQYSDYRLAKPLFEESCGGFFGDDIQIGLKDVLTNLEKNWSTL